MPTTTKGTKLTQRTVDALTPGEKDYFLWCADVPGFGVRVYPSGRKCFVFQCRQGGGTRRLKLGWHGQPQAVEKARKRAHVYRGVVAAGDTPSDEAKERRESMPLKKVCDLYLTAAEAGLVMTRRRTPKSSSTIAIDRGRIARHIVPTIGNVPVNALARSDVQRMVDAVASGVTAGEFKGKARGKAVVRGGNGTAARVAELLGGILTWAEKRGFVKGINAVRGVETVRGAPKDRVLADSEFAALGAVTAFQFDRPMAAQALKLIALTGLRRQEAVGLRWSEIDLGGSCLRLETTKTGRSVRPIGLAAVRLLSSLPRTSDVFVFPSKTGEKCADLKKACAALFDAAELKGVRSQALRRSFASTAANLGLSDATIAELIGHARRSVTARHYVRRPDRVLIEAATAVARCVERLMAGEMAAVVPFPGENREAAIAS